jgi:hypothetical protein
MEVAIYIVFLVVALCSQVCVCTSVSREHSAFIFRVEVKMKAVCSSEVIVSALPPDYTVS